MWRTRYHIRGGVGGGIVYICGGICKLGRRCAYSLLLLLLFILALTHKRVFRSTQISINTGTVYRGRIHKSHFPAQSQPHSGLMMMMFQAPLRHVWYCIYGLLWWVYDVVWFRDAVVNCETVVFRGWLRSRIYHSEIDFYASSLPTVAAINVMSLLHVGGGDPTSNIVTSEMVWWKLEYVHYRVCVIEVYIN